ncbi:hypothetical protein S40288_03226 [Stachybotrys chartarum IBT 40288]|nr:hypothetical protein S40288_03226 [Stachybotrys chartarum IBT 40288]
MLPQSFSTPTICIVNNLEDMAVEIHGSLGARIPNELGSMATTDDLWKAVNGKHLWLSKGGPSYLSVSIIFHGEVISDPDRANWVSQRICNWETWSQLGIRLNKSAYSRTADTGHIVFSIEHSGLPSVTVPCDAVTAEFQFVSLDINLGSVQQSVQTRPQASEKRRRLGQSQNEARLVREDTQSMHQETDPYHYLSAGEKRAVDVFVASFLDRSSPQCRMLRHTTNPSTTFKSLSWDNHLDSVEELLEAGSKVLMLGNTRLPKGLMLMQHSASYGLAHLAPAIFHMPFLKVRRIFPIISMYALTFDAEYLRPGQPIANHLHVFVENEICRVTKTKTEDHVHRLVSEE